MESKTIIAAFNNEVDAANAVNELQGQGYNPKDISIISRNGSTTTDEDKVTEGVISGASTGTVIGGLTGLLAGAGVLPALAGLLIGGPIAAALGATGIVATVVSGAITGAAAGGLIGALTKLGVSSEDAQYYHERLQEGGYIIAVPSTVNEKRARNILLAHGAQRINEINI